MKKLFILFITACLLGCEPNLSDVRYNPDANNPDYIYAKNRIRQEGYSDHDSDIAAKAIMKFQRAQERRK